MDADGRIKAPRDDIGVSVFYLKAGFVLFTRFHVVLVLD